MARSFAVILVAAAAAAAVAAPRGDGVYTLTPDNFYDLVDGSTPALVEFYAPWCGHCKSLEPEYARVGDLYKRSDGVLVAKMDADAHGSFASKYGVKGFPTIKWFGDNVDEPEDYEGGRDAAGIVDYINQRTGLRKNLPREATHVQHLTGATFDTIVMDPDTAALVEFYAPWCGHCKSLAPTYKSLAEVFAGEPGVAVVAVDATANRELAEQYGVTGYPTLKWFGKGEDKEAVDYAGGRDLKSFVNHINSHAGTARDETGALLPTAGRVGTLDSLAMVFMAGDEEARKTVLEEALPAAVENLEGADAAAGAVYAKVMQRIMVKGDGYVAKESARMASLLSKGGMSVAKATKFGLKKNVLAAFES